MNCYSSVMKTILFLIMIYREILQSILWGLMVLQDGESLQWEKMQNLIKDLSMINHSYNQKFYLLLDVKWHKNQMMLFAVEYLSVSLIQRQQQNKFCQKLLKFLPRNSNGIRKDKRLSLKKLLLVFSLWNEIVQQMQSHN